MKSPSVVLSLLAIISPILATPLSGHDSFPALPESRNFAADMLAPSQSSSGDGASLQKREAGGVYLCTDANWSGQCGYAQQQVDACIGLTSPYWHTISSIGPDEGYALVFSEDFNCAGNAYTLFNPGSSNLQNNGWNDRIGSFRVRKIAGKSCVSDQQLYLPGINCQKCCHGCNRSGQGCCPDGQNC